MSTIHNPTVLVKLAMGEIQVRELSWPDALNLYQRLVGQSKSLFDEQGRLMLDPQKLVAAINENIELGQWLVLKSTGKDEAWLNQRTLSEVLDVTSEAAVLNIGIILSRIKNVRSRLREVVAGANEMPNTKPGESTPNSPTPRSS